MRATAVTILLFLAFEVSARAEDPARASGAADVVVGGGALEADYFAFPYNGFSSGTVVDEPTESESLLQDAYDYYVLDLFYWTEYWAQFADGLVDGSAASKYVPASDAHPAYLYVANELGSPYREHQGKWLALEFEAATGIEAGVAEAHRLRDVGEGLEPDPLSALLRFGSSTADLRTEDYIVSKDGVEMARFQSSGGRSLFLSLVDSVTVGTWQPDVEPDLSRSYVMAPANGQGGVVIYQPPSQAYSPGRISLRFNLVSDNGLPGSFAVVQSVDRYFSAVVPIASQPLERGQPRRASTSSDGSDASDDTWIILAAVAGAVFLAAIVGVGAFAVIRRR